MKVNVRVLVLLLTLAMAAIGIGINSTKAAEVETYMFITVAPNPVGKGQTVFVMFWLNVYPPTAAGAGGDRWRGITVTIWKPDNTTEIKGPFTSDPVGGAYFAYTPDQVGTYYFQAHFPGQVLEAGPNPYPPGLIWVGTYFKPSTSKKVALVVQEEPVPLFLPPAELPVGYWKRPISSELREWHVLAGPWLMSGSNYWPARRIFNPYTKAPETAHVVWTKELTFGGIIGGATEEDYYSGITYESKFSPPIILQGRLYYNKYPATPPLPGMVCVDLRTGETIWEVNATGGGPVTVSLSGYGQVQLRLAQGYTRLTYGQIYLCETPNQHGGIPYLWATGGLVPVWDVYDAVTGAWLYRLENVTPASYVFGPSGELLGYMLDSRGRWLAMWNSSKVKGLWGGEIGSEAWQWRPPVGEKLNWRTGIQWNKTLSESIPGQGILVIDPDTYIIIATSVGDVPAFGFSNELYVIAYNGTTGERLWTQHLSWPFSNTIRGAPYGHNIVVGEGVVAIYQKENLRWIILDLKTGQQICTTDPRPGNDFGMYVEGGNIAYGKLYSAGYDGLLCCWDLKTGKLLWSYSSGTSGQETAYGTWPLVTGPIADGKIYVYTSEHSPNSPLYRGAALHCLDAEKGTLLWKISGWWGHNHYGFGPPVVAEGYLVAPNYYDGQIYCFGKGQTKVELEAPLTAVSSGSSVVIRGRVLDISPAVKDTPCVADEDMTAWMEYLVMQKPMPQTVKGVTVELYAIAEDGTTISIGTVTTDPLNGGIFSVLWTPPKEGIYIITAVFPGSKSYWDSYASTAIGVTAAPAPAAAIEALQPWNILLTVLVIIAIVIGIVNLYTLRKRK